MPSESRSHEQLVQAMLALENRAKTRLGAQGRAYTRASVVRMVRDHHKIDLQNNLSAWLNMDPSRRPVPAETDAVWAVVQVWSHWAGISDANHRYWSDLVESARAERRSGNSQKEESIQIPGGEMGHHFNVGSNSIVTNESTITNSRIGQTGPGRNVKEIKKFIDNLRDQVVKLGDEEVVNAFEVLDSETQRDQPDVRIVSMSVSQITKSIPQVGEDPILAKFLREISAR